MGGIGEEEQDDLSAVPEEGRRLMIGTVGKEERPLAALIALPRPSPPLPPAPRAQTARLRRCPKSKSLSAPYEAAVRPKSQEEG
jgi:hypothetical protein